MAGTKRLKIFVDSGAWIAMSLSRDSLHEEAVAAYENVPADALLVTSSGVYDESITRVRYDGGLRVAERLRRLLDLAQRRGKLELVWVGPDVHDEAWTVIRRNEDLKLSFTDATSAAIARRAGIKTVFGFDGDFRALGFDVIPSAKGPLVKPGRKKG